ncbi:MAG: MBL fold metallo-hydrolase [Candidatus Bipolaricaulaceae bacterium]
MEIVAVCPGVAVLRGGVNLGVLVAEGEAVFVDAGLDEGAARRLWRWAEEKGLRPRAALLTHAHADHFGGAHFWEGKGLPLWAPPMEAAGMRHPLWEPIFLFSGASPLPALRGKFTLAQPLRTVNPVEPGPLDLGPVRVEVVALPGHAPEQVGVAADGVLFCADALFPPEILAKHPIPFCYDLAQALRSLEKVRAYAHVVPGHGAPLREAAVACAARTLQDRLLAVAEEVERALALPRTGEELVGALVQAFGVRNLDLVGFLLARTTVFASLSFLVAEGRAEPIVEGGRLLWRRK